MPTAKEAMTEIIQRQPDDSSFHEILRELALARMVKRGLDDADVGRVISNVEIDAKIQSWPK